MSLLISNNFNKIAFIDWSKVLIMPKHVFYNLFYSTIMSNMIKEKTNFFLLISNNFNKIAFID
jgi:hypothetical protein